MEARKLSLQEMSLTEGGSKAGCAAGGAFAVAASFVSIGFIVFATGPIGAVVVAELLAGQTLSLAGTIVGCVL